MKEHVGRGAWDPKGGVQGNVGEGEECILSRIKVIEGC